MNTLKRFPHFKQHDTADCGLTSLQKISRTRQFESKFSLRSFALSLRIIAKFYGLNYSAEMLRKHCHISRRDVNIQYISEYGGREFVKRSVLFQKNNISQ